MTRLKANHRRRPPKAESPVEVHERDTAGAPGKPTITPSNHAANVGQREDEIEHEVNPDDHEDEGRV